MSKIFKAFREHEKALRRIVAKYRPNPSDIDELTQETFIRAYAAELKQDIREPARFLFRVAKNLSIKQGIRKENNVTKSVEDYDGVEVIIDESQTSQEEIVDSRKRLIVFMEALESLSPELRETLVMRSVQGLTVQKVATRLDLSVSTVEKRLANAMVDCHSYIRSKGLDPADFGAIRKKKRLKRHKQAPVGKVQQEEG